MMMMFLMAATIVAVSVAVALGVMVVQLRSAERRRSEARVAALALAAGVAPGVEDFRPGSAFVDETPAADDIAEAGGLFAEPAADSPWTARLAIGGAVGLAAIGLVVGASLAGGSSSDAPATVAAATAGGPLALRSLQHEVEKGALTISGRVENDGTAPVTGVIATAYLFAADGTFLTSGRAALANTPLEPGAASGFTIDVPVSGAVARYRVSFRDATGRVVRHLDRRDGQAVARNE